MKQFYATVLCLSLYAGTSTGQAASDYAVQLRADIQVAPPRVTLSWKPLSGVTGYSVFRKVSKSAPWVYLASPAATDTSYVDATVSVDTAYEYKVAKSGSVSAFGYLYAGINAQPVHQRGSIVLLVDTLFRDSCAAGITRLMDDLSGDGWRIVRHDISRTVKDTAIKNIIKTDYSKLTDLTAVLIVGHVAVPYSGLINPDAHPDHLGAWPADVYYGDMDGAWTDATVNATAASRTANQNVPGDGKWDQSELPSNLELQVSRIDVANMPLFGKSEVEMMQTYLDKAHLYKMDSLAIVKRALIDDNFGAFSGEAFAANGWRNFAPVVGRGNIQSADYITALNDSSYQWAFGCGGGSYTSASGIGNTIDFKGKNVKNIFTVMFGSYFGDWDAANNFLRAPLCADEPALTSCWAGRPNWFFHHMALGEHIGYSTFISQNNSGTAYAPSNFYPRYVHMALLGDLSLRTDYIQPASRPVISAVGTGGVKVDWAASPDPDVAGYYVYRSDSLYGSYKRISSMLTTLTFNDVSGSSGLKYYMVRPVKLEQTPSGTYYNLGLGLSDSATVSYPVSVENVSMWRAGVVAYPNPADALLNVYFEAARVADIALVIVDFQGREVSRSDYRMQAGEHTITVDVSTLVPGNYLLRMEGNGEYRTVKFSKKQIF